MKRVLCVLVFVILLLVGTTVVFADPYAVPGTNSVSTPYPLTVDVNEPVGE